MKFKTIAASAVGIGVMGVMLIASPAAATHPAVTLLGVCNTETGLVDLTGTVAGDSGYQNVEAVIKSETLPFGFVGLTVKGSSVTQTKTISVPYASEYKLEVAVQFANHNAGDLIKNSGVFKPSFDSCVADDKLDAVASVKVLTEATCEADGTVEFAIENAVWDDEADVTDGERSATALDGHVFSDGSKTAVVTYTFPGKVEGEECIVTTPTPTPPPPVEECDPNVDKCLAVTGYELKDAWPWFVAGGIALGAGIYLFVTGRRKGKHV